MMAETSYARSYGKCAGTRALKDGEGGGRKACPCKEFDPKEDDEKDCDCCSHHRSFHIPRQYASNSYKRCGMDEDEVDGEPCPCQEYDAPAAGKTCSACGHHRSNHDPPGSIEPNQGSQPMPPRPVSLSYSETRVETDRETGTGIRRPRMSSEAGFLWPPSREVDQDSQRKRTKRMLEAEGEALGEAGEEEDTEILATQYCVDDEVGEGLRGQSPGIAVNPAVERDVDKPQQKLHKIEDCYVKWLKRLKDSNVRASLRLFTVIVWILL